jgi:hypothetical protein
LQDAFLHDLAKALEEIERATFAIEEQQTEDRLMRIWAAVQNTRTLIRCAIARYNEQLEGTPK